MTVWQRFLVIGLLITLSQLSHGANFKTGDEQLNRWLINIDFVAAEQDRLKNLEKLGEKFSVEAEQLAILQENYEFSFAQLHMLLAVFQVTGKDWSDLIAQFVRYNPNRYDVLLSQLGIAKDSSEHQQIKTIIQQAAPKGDPEAEYQKKRRRGK